MAEVLTAAPALGGSQTNRSCLERNVSVSLGASFGAAGTSIQLIVFRNRGTSTCTVEGYPSVTLTGSGGRSHKVRPIFTGSPFAIDTGKPHRLVVSPAGTVSAQLLGSDVPEARRHNQCSTFSTFSVVPPGMTKKVTFHHKVHSCSIFGIGPVERSSDFGVAGPDVPLPASTPTTVSGGPTSTTSTLRGPVSPPSVTTPPAPPALTPPLTTVGPTTTTTAASAAPTPAADPAAQAAQLLDVVVVPSGPVRNQPAIRLSTLLASGRSRATPRASPRSLLAMHRRGCHWLALVKVATSTGARRRTPCSNIRPVTAGTPETNWTSPLRPSRTGKRAFGPTVKLSRPAPRVSAPTVPANRRPPLTDFPFVHREGAQFVVAESVLRPTREFHRPWWIGPRERRPRWLPCC
jgi:hypothetical protein